MYYEALTFFLYFSVPRGILVNHRLRIHSKAVDILVLVLWVNSFLHWIWVMHAEMRCVSPTGDMFDIDLCTCNL